MQIRRSYNGHCFWIHFNPNLLHAAKQWSHLFILRNEIFPSIHAQRWQNTNVIIVTAHCAQ